MGSAPNAILPSSQVLSPRPLLKSSLQRPLLLLLVGRGEGQSHSVLPGILAEKGRISGSPGARGLPGYSETGFTAPSGESPLPALHRHPQPDPREESRTPLVQGAGLGSLISYRPNPGMAPPGRVTMSKTSSSPSVSFLV